MIQAQRDLVELRLSDGRQVGFSREVLPQQQVRIFIRPALPRTLRIAEVNLHIRRDCELLMLGQAKGLNVNWVEFSDRWRQGYGPAMNRVRRGEIPWTNLDDLQRMILEELLRQYKIEGLTEEERLPGPMSGDD